MNRILIETQYLPSLEFFCAIRNANEIQIEYYEHFVKQSYRNHAFIRGANGIEKMTSSLFFASSSFARAAAALF